MLGLVWTASIYFDFGNPESIGVIMLTWWDENAEEQNKMVLLRIKDILFKALAPS